jgi:phosphatidylglycerophosphatase A
MSGTQSDNLTFGEAFRRASLPGKTALALASWFGTGLIPQASGTFGTLAAVPLVLWLCYLDVFYQILGLGVVTAVAVWVSGKAQDLLARNDPSEVVIDEVAGFVLTMCLLPSTVLTLGAGFFLFRLLDILKPYPIRRMERVPRGLGVVLDDLVAGLFANVGVRVVWVLFTRT